MEVLSTSMISVQLLLGVLNTYIGEEAIHSMVVVSHRSATRAALRNALVASKLFQDTSLTTVGRCLARRARRARSTSGVRLKHSVIFALISVSYDAQHEYILVEVSVASQR